MSTTTPDAGTEIRYATVNPFTGETVQEFDFLDSAEVPRVVERAASAYRAWRERTVEERAAVVGRAAELMLERIDDLAATITTEMGKRLPEAQGEVKLA